MSQQTIPALPPRPSLVMPVMPPLPSRPERRADNVPRPNPREWQQGIPAPARMLTVRSLPTAGLWVVGAHGGSGESVIAALNPYWMAAEHCFPTMGDILICCRTSAYGLECGRMALQQYLAGLAGCGRLIGLAIVADMPGKIPKELKQLGELARSLAPTTVEFPFDKTLRLEPYPPTNQDRFGRQRSLIESLIGS